MGKERIKKRKKYEEILEKGKNECQHNFGEGQENFRVGKYFYTVKVRKCRKCGRTESLGGTVKVPKGEEIPAGEHEIFPSGLIKDIFASS